MSEPFFVLAVLDCGSRGSRAAASGVARCLSLRYALVIDVLPRILALRPITLRLRQKNGQFFHNNRAISWLRQVRGYATGTYLLVRHPEKNPSDILKNLSLRSSEH